VFTVPPHSGQQAAPSVHSTTSCKHSPNAPEDGQNHHTKHAELIEIVNKIIIFASSWLFILLYIYHVYLIVSLEACREDELCIVHRFGILKRG